MLEEFPLGPVILFLFLPPLPHSRPLLLLLLLAPLGGGSALLMLVKQVWSLKLVYPFSFFTNESKLRELQGGTT